MVCFQKLHNVPFFRFGGWVFCIKIGDFQDYRVQLPVGIPISSNVARWEDGNVGFNNVKAD